MATFENANVGDVVFSTNFGWGEITAIDTFHRYPINARFNNNEHGRFTFEGYNNVHTKEQTLFFDAVVIDINTVPVKVINGVEVPDISYTPEIGRAFYMPLPTDPSLYVRVYNNGTEVDRHRIASGLAYPITEEGRQSAILHAKAMLKQ
jgi:hypothetical protein